MLLCLLLIQETWKHLFRNCIVAQKYWGRILRMFSRTYRGVVFKWGTIFLGSFDVQVSLYETKQCAEALRMFENRIEVVLPNIHGVKYFKNSFVWNIVMINALWVW